ncbi:hypothetical protein ABZ319_33555 [Nocardia sp. NPDC005978]|uniref:hypothetical protein n=1 Tax=Nocardia sp. NPDC005978 TaxID=3156725 RepID=UPI0033B58E89
MTLSRKGTRILTVNEQRYRWTVSATDLPSLRFVVEAAEGAAQRMVVRVGAVETVSPRMVATAVEAGLRAGWTPDARGPELHYRLTRGRLVAHAAV